MTLNFRFAIFIDIKYFLQARIIINDQISYIIHEIYNLGYMIFKPVYQHNKNCCFRQNLIAGANFGPLWISFD